MKDFKTLETVLGLFLFLFLVLTVQVQAQKFEFPTTNSKAVVQQRVAATDIEVKYNRPSVKGRKIFGSLVPYGEVWRTGSDAATNISFSTPVSFGGKEIEAGSYELFSIPGENEWTVILNSKQSQWGSYAYDPEFDAARIKIKPHKLYESVETFSIGFNDVTNNTANLNIIWDKVRVSVPIEIDVEKTVVPKMEEALKGEGKKPYFLAAMFYYENDLNINRAAELMELAIKDNPNHIGMLHRLALILERKGDIDGAKEAAKKSLDGAASVGSEELKKEYQRLNTILLERLNKM